jgi:hypothetical protein
MQRLLVRVLQPYLSIDGEAKLTEQPMSASSAYLTPDQGDPDLSAWAIFVPSSSFSNTRRSKVRFAGGFAQEPRDQSKKERPAADVGLLSAAQYHGAAHHHPQVFQVMLAKPRRPIVCGAVRVAFIVRKRLDEVFLQTFNTPRGTIRVSTPEATAIDLAGYPHRAGGLDSVVTVLVDLAERMDPDKLGLAAQTAPIPWAQRLGYLLDHVGAADKTSALEAYVHRAASKAPRDERWKLYINAEVSPES